MKVAKPTTSACISNSCNELHLPGRAPRSRAAEVPQPVPSRGGTHPELTVRPVSNGTPSLRRRNGGSSPSRHQQQEFEPDMFGISKFHVFDIDSFFKLVQAMAMHHSPGHPNASSVFSNLLHCPSGAIANQSTLGQATRKGRDEMGSMGLHTAGGLFFYVLEIALFRQGQQFES